MAETSEITGQEFSSEESPNPSKLGGFSLFKKIFKNRAAIKRFIVMEPGEERFIRQPRQYEIPPFHKSMQYCKSNEKYLRPTRWCNPREPEVIAIANELGAFEISDFEFAEAAFWFVKTKLVPEMLPLTRVSSTLKRGSGTCYHLTSVWIALCRAAGIKARYKSFNMFLPQEITEKAAEKKDRMTQRRKDMISTFNTGTPEAEGEVFVDGRWIVGHVAMRPEIYARLGLPIPRFGEDAIGLTFDLAPGTMQRYESIPLDLGIRIKALMSLAPALMERASIHMLMEVREGERVFEKAGGMAAYDRQAREISKRRSLTVEPEHHEALVFEQPQVVP